MGLFNRLKEKMVTPKREPVVIGAWDSDLVEIREHGKVTYKVQTLDGLKTLLNSVESERGHGSVKLKWWVAGLGFDLSADIPLDVLMKLNNEVK